MSRVHCIDCGIPVVVDPNGLCPDGHLVGTAGARIESAIGTGTPHPDEPEPWVSSVEHIVDVTPEGGGGASGATTQTLRTPRPPTAPGHTAPGLPRAAPSDATGRAEPGSNGRATTSASNGYDAAEADDLLRELHSLSDDLADLGSPAVARHLPPPTKPLFKVTPPAAAPPAASPPAATPPAASPPAASHPATSPAAASPPQPVADPPSASPSADIPTAPSEPATMDGLAELRALEAAVHALTGSGIDDIPSDPQPTAERSAIDVPPTADDGGIVTRLPEPADRTREAPDRDQLAEVEELFARRPRPLLEEPAPNEARPPLTEAPPIPAFERTPWSAQPVDEAAGPVLPPVSTERPPAAAPVPDAAPRARRSDSPPPPSDGALDLGNFTAKGRRVGTEGSKRRRRSR